MSKKNLLLIAISIISIISALINIGLFATDHIEPRLFFNLFVVFNIVFLVAFSLFSFISIRKKYTIYFVCLLQLLPLIVLIGRG